MSDIPDSSWIIAGEGALAANLLKRAIKVDVQRNILDELSEEEKQKGYGFACQVVISGEGGGIFNLCFSKDGVQPKPPDVPLRNTVITSIDTLLKLASFKVSHLVVVKPDGEEITGIEAFVWMVDNGYEDKLPPLTTQTTIQEAFANQEIFFAGDLPNLDMVEWQKIYEKAINKHAMPAIRDLMIRGFKYEKSMAGES